GGPDLRIRVSGCHNGCAQPEMGDIGIFGEGRRLHGKLIPHYQTYFGGDGTAGGALAIKGPSVPTARVEQAIARVKQQWLDTRATDESFFRWARRQQPDYFKVMLADLVEVRAEDVAELARDHGDAADFKVLQLGGGECAGASQVQVGSAFFDAAHERQYRNALYFQRKYAEAAQCAETIVRVIGQGLLALVIAARSAPKVDDLNELSRALAEHLPSDLTAQLAALVAELGASDAQWDEPKVKALSAAVDAWTLDTAEFCVSRDRQLDLAGALPPRAQPVVLHFAKSAAAA
ncbi:MAG: hypothetical protein ACREUQ_12575, partial [Burkholderiales bacterium]